MGRHQYGIDKYISSYIYYTLYVVIAPKIIPLDSDASSFIWYRGKPSFQARHVAELNKWAFDSNPSREWVAFHRSHLAAQFRFP